MNEYEFFNEGPKVDAEEAARLLNEFFKGTRPDVTVKEVNREWHDARDDGEQKGGLQRGSAPGSGGQGGKK